MLLPPTTVTHPAHDDDDDDDDDIYNDDDDEEHALAQEISVQDKPEVSIAVDDTRRFYEGQETEIDKTTAHQMKNKTKAHEGNEATDGVVDAEEVIGYVRRGVDPPPTENWKITIVSSSTSTHDKVTVHVVQLIQELLATFPISWLFSTRKRINTLIRSSSFMETKSKNTFPFSQAFSSQRSPEHNNLS